MRTLLLFLSVSLTAAATEVVIDLRNPTYRNGVIYTDEGGVVKGKDLRIQAREIEYTRKKDDGQEIHHIVASGDLMIQYKDRVFVGKRFEYDFMTNTGVVFEGKTFFSLWYISGERIELNADGTYEVENAS